MSANRSRKRDGHAANDAWADLRGGVPRVPALRSQELKVFGAIEVARHRLLPGEMETLPFKGHLVSMHLSGPHRLVQRRNGRTHEGLEATKDVDVLPAGTPGYWRMGEASRDMSMLLEDQLIRRIASESDVWSEDFEVVPFFSAPDTQIECIGALFLAEMETGGLGSELYAESLANALAMHLLRSHSSLGYSSRRRIGREVNFPKSVLSEATDYINDNLSRKLTLEEIAEVARMSPFHFARSFKAQTGLSPHQYVIQKRVERAKALLSNNDLSIAEVAEAVGFSNQSHLAYHTRRLLGVPPLALRRGS